MTPRKRDDAGADDAVKPMYIYILANRSGGMYVGVTNDLARRLWEHRNGQGSAFAAKYAMRYLVHVEEFANPLDAIAREKQFKGWRREKKVALVEAVNPEWRDLSEDWAEPTG